MRHFWDTRVSAFVAALLEMRTDFFGKCQALGFLDDAGDLRAGVVYHNWNPEAGVMEISAAALDRRWGGRDTLGVIFAYPFDVAGCQMVVGRTEDGNRAPLHIWRALGADQIRIPRLRGRDKAEILSTLTVEQWRASKFARTNGR